jgi:calcium binding protein 39
MKKYLGFESNLKIIMNSMVNTIKIEAFHVFKLFVYNPKKPENVKSILKNNKDKLIGFLTDLKAKSIFSIFLKYFLRRPTI